MSPLHPELIGPGVVLWPEAAPGLLQWLAALTLAQPYWIDGILHLTLEIRGASEPMGTEIERMCPVL